MELDRWSYRPHLDGLRACAVYLVVLFHSDLTHFSGGFIGVDVFFVLSGFLVTNVLFTQLVSTGKIALVDFYARRVRRLLPAGALAIIGISFFAMLFSAAPSRGQFSSDSAAASLWFANWHFIHASNDYFSAAIDGSPFLHFWSLAIEEQFYLVFQSYFLRCGDLVMVGFAI